MTAPVAMPSDLGVLRHQITQDLLTRVRGALPPLPHHTARPREARRKQA